MKTWSADQVRAFFDAIRDDDLYALLRLSVMTGMRRGEVVGLRWRDVHLDEGFLSVAQARVRGLDGWTTGKPKTRSSARRIDLDPVTVEVLRARRESQVVVGIEDYVFDRGDGQPLDPDGVTKAFQRLRARTALPRIRLHDLRHTMASLALAGGEHMKVVQERLGHASIAMTMDLYSHVPPTMQRDAADRLARAIDG